MGLSALDLDSLMTATPTRAATANEGDPELLRDADAVELLVVAVYERVMASRLLSPAAMASARTILAHEQAHIRALTSELRRWDISAAPAPAGEDHVESALADRHVSGRLTKLRSEKDALRLLHEVETAAEAVYFEAIAKLRDPRLQLLSAQILASEAQHEAVLSELLDPRKIAKALPDAFIQGKR